LELLHKKYLPSTEEQARSENERDKQSGDPCDREDSYQENLEENPVSPPIDHRPENRNPGALEGCGIMAVENSVSILKMIDLLDIGGIMPKCLVSDRDLDSPDSIQEAGQASKLDGRYMGRLTERPLVVFIGPPPFLVIDVDPEYFKILPVLLAEACDFDCHRREELAVAGKIVGHH
jgi:hypothetical protein